MINGAHIVIYTTDADADRAFFRDVLKLSSVDGGHGWLIFAMPPLEAAFHDSEKNGQHAVSYTHLDVYKRQPRNGMRFRKASPRAEITVRHHWKDSTAKKFFVR